MGDTSRNTWRVRLQGINTGFSDWNMPVYGEDTIISQWDIFSGGVWNIDKPASVVWIEIKPEEPGCLIERLLFNQIEHGNRMLRGRQWPPPVGSPILQSYIELPYKEISRD